MHSTIYSLVLGTHILGGMISLFSGPLALGSPNESKQQKISVWIYFFAMLATCLSGATMALVLKSPFLFVIAAFSFYTVFTGFRAFTSRPYRPGIPEILAIIAGIPAAVYMLLTGEIVLMVFGGIFFLQILGDLYGLAARKNFTELSRALVFVQKYAGAYIATTTAFIVVNLSGTVPGWILWLGPTIVGTPMIFYLSRRLTQRVQLGGGV